MNQYWCPLILDVILGDANGVWWQFHDCDQSLEHEHIDPAHNLFTEFWPLGDMEGTDYFRAVCQCSYMSSKQAVERAAVLSWRNHYLRAKAQVDQG